MWSVSLGVVGGGLKVEYCYTREDRETFRLTSVCSMLLTLTNMREGSIRHIKITASDTRYPVQTFGEIPAIETGTSIQVPFAIDFKVRTTLKRRSPPTQPTVKLFLCKLVWFVLVVLSG